MSIRAKLLSLILLISFLPILIIGYFNYFNFKEVIEHQTQHNLEVTNQDKREKVELFLLALKVRVQDLASDGFIRDGLQRFDSVTNRETIKFTVKQHLINNKLLLDERMTRITLLNKKGVAIVSTDDADLGRDYSEIYPLKNNKQEIISSDLFFDTDSESFSIEVLAPVYSRTEIEKYFGSVLISFNASMLERVVSIQQDQEMMHDEMEGIRLDTAESYLVNAQRQMITKSRFIDEKPMSIVVDTFPVKACLSEMREVHGYWLDYRGVEVFGSSSCINMGSFRWVLLSEMDVTETLTLIDDYQWLFGLLVLVILLIVLVVSLYLTWMVSAPIKLLNDGVKRIAAGNLSFTVGTSQQDEIGELSRSFDMMLTAIKNSKSEIEAVNKSLNDANQELGYVKDAMDEHAIIVETDSSGFITRVNRKFCEISQYAADEIVGQTHQLINSGYHPSLFFENMWQIIASGKVWHGEICNRRKDGGIYWVNTTIVPYLNKHGKVERFIAMRTDITQQKKIEQNLLRFNRRLLASANIEKAILDALDEKELLSAACKVLVEDGGYSHAWVGYVFQDVEKSIKPVAQFGYPDDYFESARIIWGDDELSSDPVGIVVRCGSEMIIRDIAADDDFAPRFEYFASLGTRGIVYLPLRDGQDVFGVISVHTQDNNVFDADEVALLKRLANDVAYGIVSIRAKNDRDRAEAALEKSEESLRMAQEIAHFGSWQWDVVSDKHIWSDEQFRILGYQPGEITPCLDAFLKSVVMSEREQIAADIKQSIEAGISRNFEFRITKPHGELCYVMSQLAVYLDDNYKVVRVVGTLLDLTDKKRAEDENQALQNQLQHAQKLDSIGQLTGGVAHDFNNILSSIMGYTSLAIEECPENNPEFLEYLAEVNKAGIRAKELIAQLMAFSRRETKEAEVLSLVDIVQETLNMLKPTIPAVVELNLDVENDLPSVRANAVQVHQVITNLVINAADSIQDFGMIDVRVQKKRMDDSLCTSCQQSFSGGFIELSVTDTGKGISEQDLIRMFEPFFTTKEPGKGTGMGLAMVHGLLHSHDGHIQVESNPGQGSRFSLYFPYEHSASETERPVIETPTTNIDSDKTGTILVVDDEEQISKMICSLLTRRGYQCVEANAPERALQLFESEPNRFDLVITDQMMPKMMGMEMAALMLAKRPQLPIVLCTGYSGKINNDDVEKAGLKGFIDKPIDFERMIKTINSLIER